MVLTSVSPGEFAHHGAGRRMDTGPAGVHGRRPREALPGPQDGILETSEMGCGLNSVSSSHGFRE